MIWPALMALAGSPCGPSPRVLCPRLRDAFVVRWRRSRSLCPPG